MTAVAGADDKDLLTLPFLGVVVLAGVQNLAAEATQRRDIRKARNAADSGSHHDVSRTQLPLGAVPSTQHNGPSFFCFVVRAALEFRSRPVVKLHAFHVGLEPPSQFVFGNVGRPARWKRHVWKVVDVDLVVQGQRAITLAPVVTDAPFTIHDQGIDLQLSQTGCDRKPGLPPANDQYNRISLDILGGGSPEVEPVRAAKVA